MKCSLRNMKLLFHNNESKKDAILGLRLFLIDIFKENTS